MVLCIGAVVSEESVVSLRVLYKIKRPQFCVFKFSGCAIYICISGKFFVFVTCALPFV